MSHKFYICISIHRTNEQRHRSRYLKKKKSKIKGKMGGRDTNLCTIQWIKRILALYDSFLDAIFKKRWLCDWRRRRRWQHTFMYEKLYDMSHQSFLSFLSCKYLSLSFGLNLYKYRVDKWEKFGVRIHLNLILKKREL